MNHCQTKTTNKIIMKIKHLLIGLFAVAATVACTQEQPAETPKLEVDKEAVSLAATAAESSFNVTSNQAWAATADADWVTLDPASGEAATEAVAVKVTAEDNTAKEARTAKVTVMAGELTKTVTVTQAAAGEEPEPEKPVVEEKTYILVGDAVGGWNVDENGVVLTLDGTTDGYYVAKAVEVTGQKGMHFTKNSSWEGNVKGKHGLIAPNEIGEVGGNDISLTESGTYDVYLTEALDKFYFMSDGKLPSEAVEHVDIAVVWGVCGAYGNNDWGNGDPDVVLAQEGEWYVAKNLEFTELNFKVRGNNSWADDLKWGCAAKGQTCELNKAIAVSTCTEYKVANPGENDNPNVYIGGAGTYDVYFSPDKKEVWVMTPGYKPGDATPEPDPVDVTYTLTGTVEGHYWDNNAAAGLMTLEGDYYVVKNISLLLDSTMQPDGTNPADYVKFKICETGTWNAYGVAAENADVKYAPNTEIPVVSGGSDIFVDGAGKYDVYFDKTNGKLWVMAAGYKPGETPATPEPEGVKVLFEGPFDASWDNAMNALSYDGYDWSTASVGDIIKIYGHPTDASASWYGMNFRTGEGWAAFTEVPDQFNTPTTVAIKINQKTYDELVAKKGFVLVGTGYTVDKVELIPAALEATSFEDLLNGAGTFESQNISMIGCWGDNAPSVALSASGEGYDGGYALVLKNPVDGGQYNGWKAQAALDLPNAFDPTKTYVMSFYVKASTNASVGVQYQNASYSNQGGNMSFTALTNWVYVEHEFTTGSFDDITRLIFNFGETKADFYIDNFKFGPKK